MHGPDRPLLLKQPFVVASWSPQGRRSG